MDSADGLSDNTWGADDGGVSFLQFQIHLTRSFLGYSLWDSVGVGVQSRVKESRTEQYRAE